MYFLLTASLLIAFYFVWHWYRSRKRDRETDEALDEAIRRWVQRKQEGKRQEEE
jgi:hypothetical protein